MSAADVGMDIVHSMEGRTMEGGGGCASVFVFCSLVGGRDAHPSLQGVCWGGGYLLLRRANGDKGQKGSWGWPNVYDWDNNDDDNDEGGGRESLNQCIFSLILVVCWWCVGGRRGSVTGVCPVIKTCFVGSKSITLLR